MASLAIPDYGNDIMEYMDFYRAIEQRDASLRRVVKRSDYITNPQRHNETRDGDALLELLEATLEHGIGITRSRDQVKFHKAYTNACLPLIYGDSWEIHAPRVLRQRGISDSNPFVLVQCPRRWGKTVSLATYIAAFVLTVTAQTVSIFSPSMRASLLMKHQIVAYIRASGNYRRIVKDSSDELMVATDSLPDGVSSRSDQARELQSRKTTSSVRALYGQDKSKSISCMGGVCVSAG